MPRTVSCGSSALTVPMPVRMAQARARQAWPSARASGAGDPLALAVSSAVAVQAGGDLQAHPRPAARMREKKPMFNS
jgi:hypothetical protein